MDLSTMTPDMLERHLRRADEHGIVANVPQERVESCMAGACEALSNSRNTPRSRG